ncbi:MAG: MFS transporter [Clostridia bacterium]|nr:MFS transporter [Clostridia bacterium]
MSPSYKRTKLACYSAYFTMSSVFSLPPLLFVTLQRSFGISYTLLGTLVLINFFTQLTIDLIFTGFSKYFNPKIIVRVMPILTALGLATYALIPTFFPDIAYAGLVVGTVIFSVSAGLSEVLLSPMIAAIPSENPGKDMSLLHSLYAFGFFTVVLITTVFFKLFGTENWAIITLFFAALPLIASFMFFTSPIPDMSAAHGETQKNSSGARGRIVAHALCVACIFFGSCAENAMSNWVSGYIETALKIDKALGDILGMAMFAILLGIARVTYGKYGKNITKVLLLGMIGASVCYLTVTFSPNAVVSLIACAVTGFCTAMLWPGTLIMMEEKIPGAGVTAFAMMAAAGDSGAALAPQLLGVVVDTVAVSEYGITLAEKLSLTPEQVGMKAGMLVCSVFPIIGVFVVLYIMRYFKKNRA